MFCSLLHVILHIQNRCLSLIWDVTVELRFHSGMYPRLMSWLMLCTTPSPWVLAKPSELPTPSLWCRDSAWSMRSAGSGQRVDESQSRKHEKFTLPLCTRALPSSHSYSRRCVHWHKRFMRFPSLTSNTKDVQDSFMFEHRIFQAIKKETKWVLDLTKIQYIVQKHNHAHL